MKAREYRDAVNNGTYPAPKATTTTWRKFNSAGAYRAYKNRSLVPTKKVMANVTWYFFPEEDAA